MDRIKKGVLKGFCRLLLAGAKKGILPSGLAFGLMGIVASGLSEENKLLFVTTCYGPNPTYYAPNVTRIIAFPTPTCGAKTVRIVSTIVGPSEGHIVRGAEVYGTFSDYKWIKMKPVDGKFDSDSEDAYIDLNVSNWNVGTHIVSVRGYNDSGRWGAIGDVNIEVTPGE